MKWNKFQMGWVTLLMGIHFPFLNLVAEELPGYPYDAWSQKGKYRCLEATHRKVPEEVVKNSYLIYDICIHKGFSSAAQNILRQAFEKVAYNLISKKIHSCTAASYSKMPNFTNFIKSFVAKPLGMRQVGGFITNANVFISPLEFSPKLADRFAEGYLHYFDNPSFAATSVGWKRHLSVAARKDLVASSQLPYGSDIHFWAGQLAVAMMKNLGVPENTLNLPGSFLYELGKCVLWDGNIPGSFRTLGE